MAAENAKCGIKKAGTRKLKRAGNGKKNNKNKNKNKKNKNKRRRGELKVHFDKIKIILPEKIGFQTAGRGLFKI